MYKGESFFVENVTTSKFPILKRMILDVMCVYACMCTHIDRQTDTHTHTHAHTDTSTHKGHKIAREYVSGKWSDMWNILTCPFS